jgi:catechol 2,3-dioxygenase-like lactoylglutathione lyase family enzyme
VTSVRGLAEVVLWVHDLPASLAFYRDLLGLPVISPPERVNPVFLQAGPGDAGIPAMVVLVQLPAGAPAFTPPRTLHHLALEVAVADFDALRARLEADGRAIRTGQHPVIPSRTMYVDDPDGNEVEFICPA